MTISRPTTHRLSSRAWSRLCGGSATSPACCAALRWALQLELQGLSTIRSSLQRGRQEQVCCHTAALRTAALAADCGSHESTSNSCKSTDRDIAPSQRSHMGMQMPSLPRRHLRTNVELPLTDVFVDPVTMLFPDQEPRVLKPDAHAAVSATGLRIRPALLVVEPAAAVGAAIGGLVVRPCLLPPFLFLCMLSCSHLLMGQAWL